MRNITVILLTGLLYLHCGNNLDTASEPKAGFSAKIYAIKGNVPAAGVTVKIFKAEAVDVQPTAVYTTDNNGIYSIDNLSDGVYNIWAEKDSFILFQDSVIIVSPDYSTLKDDTLESSASLCGVVIANPCHDPRTVNISIFGSNKQCTVTDDQGRFNLSGLAGGTYTILVQSSLPDYVTDTQTITVSAGVKNTLSESIVLKYDGFPIVTNVAIAQDTVQGSITVSWSKVIHPSFQDYVIYRDECKNFNFSDQIIGATKDTFFIDTSFTPPASADPYAQYCIEYHVVARNDLQEIGPVCHPAKFTYMSPLYAMTQFEHSVHYYGPDTKNATINDSVRITIKAWNKARSITSLRWYEPGRMDTLPGIVAEGLMQHEIIDTMQIAFDSVGQNQIIALVTDDADTIWRYPISVSVIRDPPRIYAGNDTGAITNSKITLHGWAKDSMGTISEWQWKIGSAAWQKTSGSEITITAPETETITTCSLAVFDDDWNRSTDAFNLITAFKAIGVAACSSQSFILKDNGMLLGCGPNNGGQLGDGVLTLHTLPVGVMANVKSVAAGYVHSLYLQNDNHVWASGNNDCGQLGDGTLLSHVLPVLIMDSVQCIAAGKYHSLFLKADGSLWGCGLNRYGQLGDGTAVNRASPIHIMDNVQAMAAGQYHSIILKKDGTVWACGENGGGQLGDGTNIDRYSPVQVLTNVRSVAAGSWHSFFIKTDGTLWGCGNNGYGQLGDGTVERRLLPVNICSDVLETATSTYISLILKTDHTLYVCGLKPSVLPTDSSISIRTIPVPVMQEVAGMAVGYYHCLILKSDGTVMAWGRNDNYQLGDGTSIVRPVPVQVHAPSQSGGTQ